MPKVQLPITQGFVPAGRGNSFRNVRGSAKRHESKAVRCGTHMEVLKHWVGRMKPDSVLEHGAGLNSTPYLRGLGIKVLTIEDEVRWRKDIDAVSYEQWDMTEVFDLVLVDGPGEQRARVVEAVMITEAYCILEHDAEAWSEDELALRMRLCERYGYSFQQESSLNPETAVMLLKDEGS